MIPHIKTKIKKVHTPIPKWGGEGGKIALVRVNTPSDHDWVKIEHL